MGFISLRFYNFRNIINKKINLDSSEIIFMGDNGQGKTNCLEAIYLLCFGASFRIRKDNLMIKHGQESALVHGIIYTGDNDRREITVKLTANGRKEIRLNSKLINDRKEIIQNLPCIIFSHSDMEYVDGAPVKKRWFINQTLSLFNQGFIDVLRLYKKCLKQRNSVLKKKKTDLLDIYDQKISQYGLEIQTQRRKVLQNFNRVFESYNNKISGIKGELKIRYLPSWEDCNDQNDVIRKMHKYRNRDITMGTTTTGPHRDQLVFYLDGKNIIGQASTGQIRLISVILKAAQAKFYQEVTGKKPVLLIDDVLLEIDSIRRRAFISNLPEYEQVFFTVLRDKEFIEYGNKKSILFFVNGGNLEIWKKPEIY